MPDSSTLMEDRRSKLTQTPRVFDRIIRNALKSICTHLAGVVELADAPDSKSGGGNPVRVRFSPPAPRVLPWNDMRNSVPHIHEGEL